MDFAAIWRQRGSPACLLYPLSLIFRGLSALRRMLYRRALLPAHRLPAPVVVVGNLIAGGAGKTPLILHLAMALSARGRRPGIVSRGYRGGARNVMAVTADSDPALVGDEPVLLARHAGCPVYVGRDRVAVGRALLRDHPDCDVILADDGLQHYRLARDVEIAVFDARGIMNGWQLPAGPLREPLSRLATVDAIVLNLGDERHESSLPLDVAVMPAPTFRMRLVGQRFHRLDNARMTCSAAEFVGQRLHAVAGIGDPQRFFAHLRALGLDFVAHPFADHHRYRREDLIYDGDAILTTEKDAVKLARLEAPLPIWVLPVTAEVAPDLAAFIVEKLNGRPPA